MTECLHEREPVPSPTPSPKPVPRPTPQPSPVPTPVPLPVPPSPVPAFDCSLFGCTCVGFLDWYGTIVRTDFRTWGCATADAQAWWTSKACEDACQSQSD